MTKRKLKKYLINKIKSNHKSACYTGSAGDYNNTTSVYLERKMIYQEILELIDKNYKIDLSAYN